MRKQKFQNYLCSLVKIFIEEKLSSPKKIFSKIIPLCFIINICHFVTGTNLYYLSNSTQISNIEQKLYLEFDNIAHLTSSQLTETYITHRGDRGATTLKLHTSYKYDTLNWGDVENYYEIELTKKGWKKAYNLSSKSSYKSNYYVNRQYRGAFYTKDEYGLTIEIHKTYYFISIEDRNFGK